MEKILKNKLEKIKLLAMDVDGTLTDASMYYTKDGEYMKKFSTRDGMGMKLLQQIGLKTAIVTTEISEIVVARAKKLNVDKVIMGSTSKDKDIEAYCKEINLSLEEVAYIGDDVNDIPIIEKAGFSACPADASRFVKNAVDYICQANGGNGAVREIAEMIFEVKSIPIKWQTD
ncbi:MAG: KdsC family phosphatase [Candidatus Kapaibacteriota bacterium]